MSADSPPLLNSQAARAYLEFNADARVELMNAHWGSVTQIGREAISKYEAETGTTVDDADTVRRALLDLPVMPVFFRIKRTLQEVCWHRIIDEYRPYEEEILHRIAAAEQQGPGSVQWNPDFSYPGYATRDIHIQPGGYTQNPLAGLIYDVGTRAFFGGGDVDALHEAMAQQTTAPLDEQVDRVIEIGCSVGQMTCALKHRFPKAEVWGTDISAPMVRYAHWRAVQNECDVQFAQMPAEDLDFPDEYADLVVAHILFHELPVKVIKGALAEAFRVLRPGGNIVIWDFPTPTPENPSYDSFMGIMDAADNGEPYALDFVRCGVEPLIKEAGFTLRSEDPTDIYAHGRIGDKPTD